MSLLTPPAADLAALLFHVGGEAFALPLNDDHQLGLQQLGTIAGLPVWSCRGTARETGHAARSLCRAGRLGLILGHEARSRRWLIVATVPPVRLATTVAGDCDALPLRRLARAARWLRPTPLEQAMALADALDADAAGRRTFSVLYQLLDRAVMLLPAKVSREDRHAWALAQITRLLFLRFVESEGWLNANPRFLADAFDRCLASGRDPTRHLLHPLFFGTLNRHADERSRFARAFGAVPFLNGGLFEPHAIERIHALHLPAAYWQDAFALLVDRVDVTLDGAADDGRVTPELLGRVFEGVMEPAERAHQGTFFTPPALVDGLLRETLACHLAPQLQCSESAMARALDDPDPELRRLLLGINVLDPAVGSGAFLVGALALLHGPGSRQLSRVRHLVTRRLHGIDRHPGAVRLCELRLWLEVLRAMRGRTPARIPPLPNLDAQVRAGDALIDPLGTVSLGADQARRISLRQRAILGAHGSTKRTAIAEARRTERGAVLRAMRDQEAVFDHEIAELLAAARAPTLFGDRPTLDAARRREIDGVRRERLALRAERRRLVRDAVAMPFALHAAFAPVMSRCGGFDLVVGNPPWVRAERLPAATRDALAQRYRWWCSSGPGWRHLPDLSVAFVERGFSVLAPGGTLAFLLPAKIATATYGAACRAGLLQRSTIHRVADLAGDPRAGFDATIYPLAIVASRRMAPAGHHVQLGLCADDPAQLQRAWETSGEWITASPAAQLINARLAREHPALRESVRAQLGVKTGANAAYLNPPVALAEWTRPAVRGRDIRPFVASSSATLLWPADSRGAPWHQLPPAVAAHLQDHARALGARADQQAGPWWQLFRTRAATAAYRVVWRDLAPELQAAVLWESEPVPLNSCYVAAMPTAGAAEALAAWLNSGPIRALARLAAEPAAGGCARFAARAVGGVPLPSGVLADSVLAALTHGAATRDVQEVLDQYVSDLLGLSNVERELLVDLAAHRR